MATRANGTETIVLAGLTAVTAAVSGVLLWQGKTTGIEAVSFVTGAVCVWMTVRENAWNFPIGLVNEVAFFVVFARARLYADAGLQVVYFGLTGLGWYWWLYGGPGRTTLPRVVRPAQAAGAGGGRHGRPVGRPVTSSWSGFMTRPRCSTRSARPSVCRHSGCSTASTSRTGPSGSPSTWSTCRCT